MPPLTSEAIELANLTPVGVGILQALGETVSFDEDCLTLNIWTKPQTGESKKAVMVWIHGGGFSSGGTNSSVFDMQYLVDQEDVIVVTLKSASPLFVTRVSTNIYLPNSYRLNIFGFPGNPRARNNLGLLDQRLALEWVRENIGNFGGDISRITIFGESAGGGSVDYYSYAWLDDPIVAGFIEQSGTALAFTTPASNDTQVDSAWYTVSQNLGCGNASSDASELLICMRTKDFESIYQALPADAANGMSGGFFPAPDDTVVFSDYVSRSREGKLIQKPLLVGSNDKEGELFRVTAALANQTLPDAAVAAETLRTFTCPAGARANASLLNDLPVWRYRYFGDFFDQRLTPTAGAYHGAELAILFNWFPLSPQVSPTSKELEIAKYMQGAWAAFAKDPTQGLAAYSGGWPTYSPLSSTLVRLAFDNQTGPNLGPNKLYDADCTPILPLSGMS